MDKVMDDLHVGIMNRALKGYNRFKQLDNLLGKGNYRSLATTLEKPDKSHWVRIHISKVLSGKASYSIDLMDALIKHTGATYEEIKCYIAWVKGGKE